MRTFLGSFEQRIAAVAKTCTPTGRQRGLPGAATFALVLGVVLLCAGSLSSAQVPVLPTSAPGSLVSSEAFIRADRLGITFVGFIDGNMQQERYRKALILGAGWTRWPLYWDRVERQPSSYNWLDYDRLVGADLRNGLEINAILLGRPFFHQDGHSVANLFQPIFADGSDNAGPDALINPANPWAQYVHYAVTRYKPGGVLAQNNSFRPEQGIRHWEIWNEPDVAHFWQGGIQAYARLLKTAAIVIKTVDPQAKIIFGGLLFASQPLFFTRVVREFHDDPLRYPFNWFFDVVAVHSYDDPWRSGWLTKFVQDTLAEYGLSRPVWVNETGVSVWNDYPGPVWAASPDQRQRLATAEQQAHFLIMSAVYAWSKNAETVFYHQLYDDCGNYPAGTDFPAHNGEFCSSGACYGDAFGIYRNQRGSHCFSQHPHPNTPRPVAEAFKLLAEVFGVEPFSTLSFAGLNEEVTVVVFRRANNEHIVVLWNNTREPRTHSIQAIGAGATLYLLNGQRRALPAAAGQYIFELSSASDYSYPDLESGRHSAIGGEPIILVESPSA